jgi:hypothetical protein
MSIVHLSLLCYLVNPKLLKPERLSTVSSRFVDDPHMPASDISIEVQSKFVQASPTLVLIV